MFSCDFNIKTLNLSVIFKKKLQKVLSEPRSQHSRNSCIGVQASTLFSVILSMLNALIVSYVMKEEEVQRMRMLDEAFL